MFSHKLSLLTATQSNLQLVVFPRCTAGSRSNWAEHLSTDYSTEQHLGEGKAHRPAFRGPQVPDAVVTVGETGQNKLLHRSNTVCIQTCAGSLGSPASLPCLPTPHHTLFSKVFQYSCSVAAVSHPPAILAFTLITNPARLSPA